MSKRWKIRVGFLVVAAVGLGVSGSLSAEEAPLSSQHSMVLHPPSPDLKISEEELKGVVGFFHKAEQAIESEDVESLMALYSDRYTNLRNGDKSFAEEIWKQIFATFDDITASHSMSLIAYDEANGQAVTECTGLLVGTPKGAKAPVSIDSWDMQRHVLIKEGEWKLFGNAGRAAERFGQKDRQVHPLF
ncbi:MAG: hypothetical protein CL910_03535 [Deltaproteobacteria bacterium]|jgi:uncharacterized protein YktA (UPF0223 family)|nr:hypothetical protein [Deltaproteobacteria bacterium]